MVISKDKHREKSIKTAMLLWLFLKGNGFLGICLLNTVCASLKLVRWRVKWL